MCFWWRNSSRFHTQTQPSPPSAACSCGVHYHTWSCDWSTLKHSRHLHLLHVAVVYTIIRDHVTEAHSNTAVTSIYCMELWCTLSYVIMWLKPTQTQPSPPSTAWSCGVHYHTWSCDWSTLKHSRHLHLLHGAVVYTIIRDHVTEAHSNTAVTSIYCMELWCTLSYVIMWLMHTQTQQSPPSAAWSCGVHYHTWSCDWCTLKHSRHLHLLHGAVVYTIIRDHVTEAHSNTAVTSICCMELWCTLSYMIMWLKPTQTQPSPPSAAWSCGVHYHTWSCDWSTLKHSRHLHLLHGAVVYTIIRDHVTEAHSNTAVTSICCMERWCTLSYVIMWLKHTQTQPSPPSAAWSGGVHYHPWSCDWSPLKHSRHLHLLHGAVVYTNT